MNTILKINDAIELAFSIGQIDLAIALQEYRGIMSDALEVVGQKCEEVLEFMEEHNMQDESDETLTQSEQDSWIGLSAVLGNDYPIPAWYQDMWIDNPHTEDGDV